MFRSVMLGFTLSAATFGAAFAMEAPVGKPQLPALTERAQLLPFLFGGSNYCWYPDGWNGPGFYWCGYPWRRGMGWGGPAGWNGWHGGGGYRHEHGPEHMGGHGSERPMGGYSGAPHDMRHHGVERSPAGHERPAHRHGMPYVPN